jgi:hypothetical protein
MGRSEAAPLRPRLGVPEKIGMAFLAPAVTAFATFALIGFYAALIPSLLRDSLGQSSPFIAGLVVFGLFGLATAVTVLTAHLAERTAMELLAAERVQCGSNRGRVS